MIEWRKIPFAPNRYEVSRTGLVRVLDYEVFVQRRDGNNFVRHVEGHILNPRIKPTGKSKGHPIVNISSSNGDLTNKGETRVNILVARAFHGCPYTPGDLGESQKWRIRHLDGDIANVHADNLEWVSNSGTLNPKAQALYDRNLRRLEEMRHEPIEDWIKRIWGEDYEAA